MLLFLLLQLLLQLFHLAKGVVVLFLAFDAPSLAAASAGLERAVGLVNLTLAGPVSVFDVRLPLRAALALLFLFGTRASDLARFLLVPVRKAAFFFGILLV